MICVTGTDVKQQKHHLHDLSIKTGTLQSCFLLIVHDKTTYTRTKILRHFAIMLIANCSRYCCIVSYKIYSYVIVSVVCVVFFLFACLFTMPSTFYAN